MYGTYRDSTLIQKRLASLEMVDNPSPGIAAMLGAFVLLLILGSTHANADAREESWDGRIHAPEGQGIDSTRLLPIFDVLEEKQVPIHGLLVVRNGHIVLEAIFPPFDGESAHDVASCTKSVTATILGMAIDRGLLDSVDQSFVAALKNRACGNLNAAKKSLRIEDLLTMRAGWASLDDGLTLMQMFQSPNWSQFAMDLPIIQTPGQHHQYRSINSHLLSAVIHERTGMSLAEFGTKELFDPLGIRDVGWPSDPQGITHGWGDMRIKPRDLARIGQLYANRGVWNGKSILSERWIQAAWTPRARTRSSHYPLYGYHWWLGPGRFAAVGRGGQRLLVVPEENLVVVVTAGANGDQELILDQVLNHHLMKAIVAKNAIPPNPAAEAALRERCRAERKTTLPSLPLAHSPLARRISGVLYELKANPYIQNLRLDFVDASEARLQLHFAPLLRLPAIDIAIGLDGVTRRSAGRYGLPVECKGTWVNESTFEFELDEVGNINRWLVTLIYKDGFAEVMIRSKTGLPDLARRATPALPTHE
ncbi:MAG: serine hydrolase [Planctomycetota bacterium]